MAANCGNAQAGVVPFTSHASSTHREQGEESHAATASFPTFEATGNLGDWAGGAKQPVEVEVIGTSPMRFKVTPGDGTPNTTPSSMKSADE